MALIIPGNRVRLKADPGREGLVTTRTRERAGIISYQVQFPDGCRFFLQDQLEIFNEMDNDPLELLKQAKLGRARDLRENITHIRLTGQLANLIYSMDTTNTDFYAYQFKPVLNFLDSPNNGILIADEVGLGKTIEAGLIWTELRSRFAIRRAMVLCPAMLRPKWQNELRIKFGITASITDPDDCLRYFKEYRNGDRLDYAVITSMQGFRPHKGWDDEKNSIDSKSSQLARYLLENQQQDPLLDLLIIDEAHYLRNPESMTSKLGKLLRGVSEHVVLLSATPVHLKNEDLYHLLHLVDEDTFNRADAFDDIIIANEPLVKTRELVLSKILTQGEFISLLQKAKSNPLLTGNRQLDSLIKNPPSNEELSDNTTRAEIGFQLEQINLLGKAVTRTRKRDVKENHVVRNAIPESITLSKVELDFYLNVTALVRDFALRRGGMEGFLLVMPQRQMSSSMAAALEQWQSLADIQAEQVFEDIGYEDEPVSLGPLTQEIVSHAKLLGNLDDLRKSDSKYNRLKQIVISFLKDNPDEKLVLFAFFRPTLNYLYRRLLEDGITSQLLTGGMKDDKYEVISRFQQSTGPQVLLCSEVASEGIDLQFAHLMVNYDLPWNPMKVEQRIGRIDRIGQKAPSITIWNLFYENTIDSRIYGRLYDRLRIFERAIGGLEAVLGEEIQKLTFDLLSGKLTPEQEESRIAQTAQAIENIRAHEDKLEEEATNLVAHGDYILYQVNAARQLQRTVNGEDLWFYVRDFLQERFIGCDLRQIKNNEFVCNVRLSMEAKHALDSYIKGMNLHGQTRLASATTAIRCRFENKVDAIRNHEEERINHFHPLVRFVSQEIKQSKKAYYSPVSIKIDNINIAGVKPSIYIFIVHRWSIRGIRNIERLYYVCKDILEPNTWLSETTSENLVTLASKKAHDWLEAANVLDFGIIANIAEECLAKAEEKFNEYVTKLELENNDRADLQINTLNKHLQNQKTKLESEKASLLAENKQKGAILRERQLTAVENRVTLKLMDIEKKRKLISSFDEACIGLIQILSSGATER